MNGHEDLFGQALWDYVNGQGRDLITWTSLSPPEILRTAYLFRDYDGMPTGERLALTQSRGRILDVGAGSGSHSLWLQSKGLDVTALDDSRAACRTMEKRGVRRRLWADFFRFRPPHAYDTILLLMNGAGIAGRARRLPLLMRRLKELLKPGGSAWIHASDIYYLYLLYDHPLPETGYYGDVDFFIRYGERCTSFPWTYPAPGLVVQEARREGFVVREHCAGEDGDSLLELIKGG